MLQKYLAELKKIGKVVRWICGECELDLSLLACLRGSGKTRAPITNHKLNLGAPQSPRRLQRLQDPGLGPRHGLPQVQGGRTRHHAGDCQGRSSQFLVLLESPVLAKIRLPPGKVLDPVSKLLPDRLKILRSVHPLAQKLTSHARHRPQALEAIDGVSQVEEQTITMTEM